MSKDTRPLLPSSLSLVPIVVNDHLRWETEEKS